MGLSISEKIFRKATGKSVKPKEYVVVKPDLVVAYSGITYFPSVSEKNIEATPGLAEVGADRVVIPEKNMIFVDHLYPPTNAKEAENIRLVREGARKQGVKAYYEGAGIGHQVAAEKGLVRPGMLAIHFDGHISILGALGAYATSVHLDDLLEANVTGETWLKTPENIKVVIKGRPPAGVMARDIWHSILADIGPDGAADGVLEFHGPTIDAMSMDGRMTICDLVTFSGAEAGIINPDAKTIRYLKERIRKPFEVLRSDPDATYQKKLEYNVTHLEPLVAVPPDVQYIKPLSDVEGQEIDQALIGTCASGRMEDLRVAARILKGRRVHEGVRMLITPASLDQYRQAAEEGLINVFAEAGAIVTHSTCDTCYGRIGCLSKGERCIATATLNIPGRMGSTEAEIYLGSPAVVAASAIAGELSDPRKLLKR